MPTIVRPSGLTVTAPETYRVEAADDPTPETPPRRSPRGRGRVSGPVPMPSGPQGGSDEAGALLDALRQQDFVVVDRVNLQPRLEPTPRDGRRRGTATPIPAQQDAQVQLTVAADEDAVLLVEQDGVFSWNLPSASQPLPPAPSAATRGARRAGKSVQFTIEIHASRPAPGAARRGLLSDIVYEQVTVYALKFVARVAVGSGVRFLERHVKRGLVSMRGLDPAQWLPVVPAAVTLPPDRAARILLFVHGTFSNTIGNFGALAGTPWGQSFLEAAAAHYDAILGFDHATLADDPVTNATELLEALESLPALLPPRIDVVAFSRGGLVFRSLVEHLLPRSTLRCRIEHGIFVGCTNGGTLLAEAGNWHTLIDLYTNLAVGAFRLLTLLPQAAAAALILKELTQGLGAFVKYLATYVTGDVPGLAAMQPQGSFIRTINARQDDQPNPGAIAYFAVTSEFTPTVANGTHEPSELPIRLVTSLADGLIDRLMGESNDLVVNTASMTAIDESIGAFVNDTFAFGSTPHVYHTTYFTRPEVVGALTRWLNLPAPAETSSRTRGAGGADVLPPLARPRLDRIPAIVDTDIILADAGLLAAEAVDLIEAQSPGYVVVRRPELKLHYAFRPEEILDRVAMGDSGPLELVLGLHETDASREDSVDLASRAPATPGAPSARRTVVMSGDTPIGVVPEADVATTAGIVEMARMAAEPRTASDRARTRRAMPSFDVAVSTAAAAAPALVGGAAPVPAPVRGRRRSMPPAPAPAMVPVPPMAPAPVPQMGPAPQPAGAAPAKVECHFLAEMDGEVVLHQTTAVEVSLSRETLAAAAGRASDGGAGRVNVDPGATLIVQVIPKRNFVLVDATQARVEVDPPQPGEPIVLYFDVTAAHPGPGEVWVIVRQRQMGIARLVLTPTVVVQPAAAPARRASAAADVEDAPALTAPLDQLLVIEQQVGDTVQYLYELEMPSLNLLEMCTSAPLKGQRDDYVKALYKEIEDRYVSTFNTAAHTADVDAFTLELRAYGVTLFDELFPAPLQQLLWLHRDRIASVRIVSTEPFIPWEIVHLREPGRPLHAAEPSRFLGQMGLVRWLHNVNGLPPSALRIRNGQARYVIPDYAHPDWKLPQTVHERLYLEREFMATPIEPQPRAVQAAITTPGSFDLLHIACHGEAESDAIAHARIVLEGRVEGGNFVPTHLTASNVDAYANLKGADGSQPIVFLNACQAGRAGYKLTGIGGFAQAFLRGGAGAFIGTLWSVGDEPAFDFGKELYDQLIRGASISEAAIAAREAARRAGDATWLAYVLYAHPHARLTRA